MCSMHFFSNREREELHARRPLHGLLAERPSRTPEKRKKGHTHPNEKFAYNCTFADIKKHHRADGACVRRPALLPSLVLPLRVRSPASAQADAGEKILNDAVSRAKCHGGTRGYMRAARKKKKMTGLGASQEAPSHCIPSVAKGDPSRMSSREERTAHRADFADAKGLLPTWEL
jgi:hypothetical protein